MEADLRINSEIIIPGTELIVTASRASGPGGQHVNKTSSRVSLRWSVKDSKALTEEQRALLLARLHTRLVGEGELLLHVESERSQLKNRKIARDRLVEIVARALRPVIVRKATKPTAGSKARRLGEKKKRGLLKKVRRAGLEY